jgi:GDPmannose 4,6-dehydratase
MWRILQHESPDDFVIATGETSSLREFVATAFGAVGLDWQDHVMSDPSLLRPADIMRVWANPGKALHLLGWQARYHMDDVVRMMVAAEKVNGAGKKV